MKGILIIVLISACVLGPTLAHTQCLEIYCAPGQPWYDDPHYICDAADTVMIDTCAASPTFNKLYGRKWFAYLFDEYVIRIPWAPPDSVVELTWRSIDTSFPDVRSDFASLEDEFGSYKLIKANPTDTSGSIPSRGYSIRFLQYVDIDTVVYKLKSFNHGKADFVSYPTPVLGITGDDNEYPFVATPNPTRGGVSVKSSTYDMGVDKYQIVDVSGRLLASGHIQVNDSHELFIDLSEYPSGVYFILLGSSKLRVVKQ
jgi:hypothetical protein